MNRINACLIVTCVCLLAGCGLEPNAPRPLAKTATFDVYAVVAPGTAGALMLPQVDFDSPPVNGMPAVNQVAVSAKPIISGKDVESVQRSTVEEMYPSITVNLTPAGATKMNAATAKMTGSAVAVVVNGTVVSTPKVLTPISASFRVTGSGTASDFDEMFGALTGD